MGLWKSLAGVVRVEITSASPADTLTALNGLGIMLYEVRHTGDLTVEVGLLRQDQEVLAKLLKRRGESWKVIQRHGLYWTFRQALHRWVLLSGAALLFFFVLFLPTRVFFIRVEGNLTVPTRLIIAKAEECGIGFGAARREVRSERVKNALLEAIPELQWAGVNTSGCVATISVKERSAAEQKADTHNSVGSIVAIRDGVVRQCTVLRGNALCSVGQAVKAGQVLVSGYTDLGLSIQATRAEGEIFAETLRDLRAVALSNPSQRGALIKNEKKFSLMIGKNIIKFFKDSGISDATCVKMYEKKYLTLPGGFQLPIALVCEQWSYYRAQTVQEADSDSFDWMRAFSADYLNSQMVAGQVLRSDVRVEMLDGFCRLTGEYACLEMIGRIQSEEIVGKDGTND